MLKTKSMPTLTNKHLYHLYTLINIGFAGDLCNAILGGYLELPYALILTKNPTPCARPVGPAMGIAIAINCTKPVINESLKTLINESLTPRRIALHCPTFIRDYPNEINAINCNCGAMIFSNNTGKPLATTYNEISQ